MILLLQICLELIWFMDVWFCCFVSSFEVSVELFGADGSVEDCDVVGCGFLLLRLWSASLFLQLLFASSNSPNTWNLQTDASIHTIYLNTYLIKIIRSKHIPAALLAESLLESIRNHNSSLWMELADFVSSMVMLCSREISLAPFSLTSWDLLVHLIQTPRSTEQPIYSQCVTRREIRPVSKIQPNLTHSHHITAVFHLLRTQTVQPINRFN